MGEMFCNLRREREHLASPCGFVHKIRHRKVLAALTQRLDMTQPTAGRKDMHVAWATDDTTHIRNAAENIGCVDRPRLR